MAEGLSQRALPVAGEILAGKYRVERLIGRGGMGAVFAAQHEILGQRVALKLLFGEAARAPDAVARFLNEGRAMARIQDEHVARVMDVGTLEDGTAFMVLEYLDGMDLSALVESRGPLPVGEAVDYTVQCLEGLAQAHEVGIVHRDIKPSNLFLARKSNGSTCVKILDFGISKAANPLAAPSTGLTSTGMVMGSPRYMSPEQLKSTKNVDARSDIWSLGVVLYELLAGRTPFDGDTLGAVMATVLEAEVPPLNRPGVPPSLVAIIGRCMARKPEHRFASAADLAAALRPFALPATAVAIDRLCRHHAGVSAFPDGTAHHVSMAASQVLNQTGASWTPDTGTVRRGGSGGLKVALASVGAAVVLVAVGAAFLAAHRAPAPAVSSASVEVKTSPAATSASPAADGTEAARQGTPPEGSEISAHRPGAEADTISLDDLPPAGATPTASAESSGVPPLAEAQPGHTTGRAGPAHTGQPKPVPHPPADHPPAIQVPATYDPSHDSRK